MKRVKERLIKLLLVPRIRFYFCKIRWARLKGNMKFYEQPSAGVGENVVKYNLTAFDTDAAFGCGGRMDLVLYPLKALVTSPAAKVLIVGPRTEDDIYLAKALGLTETTGLDLFSYSPHIDVGDMHAMPYPDGKFDAVVLGWVVAYSSDPAKALQESLRVIKPGGHLAIGWEWVPESDKKTNTHIRGNKVNDIADIVALVNAPAVFINDPDVATNHHKSMIFKKAIS